MTERVQLVIDAKDNASGVLRGLTAQMGSLGGTVEQLTGTSINWGNVATQAARVVSEAMKEAFKVATEYAASVRDLSLASGATAEESSRLLQVLDDFEIKANDVTTATKALTRNGLAPTVETLAQLSDQYLQLNTAEARNAFITENLGRGGAKWANVLKEGSENILALNAGVSENLILNEQQIADYETMRLNVDEFNDHIMALQVSLVNFLVPGINDAADAYLNFSERQTALEEAGYSSYAAHRMVMSGFALESDAADDAAGSITNLTGALEESGGAAEGAATDYGKLLSMSQKLNDASREQIQLAGYQALNDAFAKSDGGISPEEAATLQEAGIALGVFDAGAAKSAASMLTMAAAVDAGTASLETYIAMLNSIPTEITTTINQVTVTGAQGSQLAAADAYDNVPVVGEAGGGDVNAGQTYLVGERGPELFRSPSGGEIVPNDKLGGGATFYGATVYISSDSMNIMDDR